MTDCEKTCRSHYIFDWVFHSKNKLSAWFVNSCYKLSVAQFISQVALNSELFTDKLCPQHSLSSKIQPLGKSI